MPARFASYALFLASSAALLTAGCSPQSQNWPGKGPEGQTVPQLQTEAAAPQTIVAVSDPGVEQRLQRLEHNVGGLESDVAGLQSDMTEAKPRLEKIDSMERHFRQLSLELDRINRTYNVSAVVPPVAKAAVVPVDSKPIKLEPKLEPKKAEVPKPAVKAAAPKEVKKLVKPAAAKNGPLKVNQVRIGEQANGNSRIVLDTSAPAKINYDIDNTEKILVIEVPDASWAAQQAQSLKNSTLISSYKAESDATGSHLIVQLKGEAQVLSASRLDPEKDAGYRVFLDIGKK